MQHNISQHDVHVDNDVLMITLRGEFTQSDMQAVIVLAERIIAEHGYYFTYADVSQMVGLSAEARRMASDWSRTHRLAGIAITGAKLTSRAMLTLLVRAMNLVRKDSFPYAFVHNQEEGLAWLALCQKEAHELAVRSGRTGATPKVSP